MRFAAIALRVLLAARVPMPAAPARQSASYAARLCLRYALLRVVHHPRRTRRAAAARCRIAAAAFDVYA